MSEGTAPAEWSTNTSNQYSSVSYWRHNLRVLVMSCGFTWLRCFLHSYRCWSRACDDDLRRCLISDAWSSATAEITKGLCKEVQRTSTRQERHRIWEIKVFHLMVFEGVAMCRILFLVQGASLKVFPCHWISLSSLWEIRKGCWCNLSAPRMPSGVKQSQCDQETAHQAYLEDRVQMRANECKWEQMRANECKWVQMWPCGRYIVLAVQTWVSFRMSRFQWFCRSKKTWTNSFLHSILHPWGTDSMHYYTGIWLSMSYNAVIAVCPVPEKRWPKSSFSSSANASQEISLPVQSTGRARESCRMGTLCCSEFRHPFHPSK